MSCENENELELTYSSRNIFLKMSLLLGEKYKCIIFSEKKIKAEETTLNFRLAHATSYFSKLESIFKISLKNYSKNQAKNTHFECIIFSWLSNHLSPITISRHPLSLKLKLVSSVLLYFFLIYFFF